MRRLIFKGIILKFSVYFPVIIGAVKINELLFEPIFGTNIPLLISLIFIFTYDLQSIWKHFRLLCGCGGVVIIIETLSWDNVLIRIWQDQ